MNEFKELKEDFENIQVPPEIDLIIEKSIKRAKAYKKGRFIKNSFIAASLTIFIVAGAVGFLKLPDLKKSNMAIENKSENQNLSEILDNSTKEVTPLPTVDSKDNLIALLDSVPEYYHDLSNNLNLKGGEWVEDSLKATYETNAVNFSDSKEYSKTNIQVSGVDEEDLYKTDGEYIYKIIPFGDESSFNIVKAYPAEEMENVSSVTFEKGFRPKGLYLDGDKVVVIGDYYIEEKHAPKPPFTESLDEIKAYVYNIEDKNHITKIKEISMEGYYVSSRMVDSIVYIITNESIDKENLDALGAKITPEFNDSHRDTAIVKDFACIKYLPNTITANYINIASINLKAPNEIINTETILGYGNNIYSSAQNLYISGTSFDEKGNEKTNIYKFALDKGEVKFIAEGNVPGSVLNQFSMDEYNEYFRIATTSDTYNESLIEEEPSDSDKAIKDYKYSSLISDTKNNMYVLDNNLDVVGEIENLAEGERIYSARFMGDKAYMVTYKQVDPLFVLDFSIPTDPKVLGELKIPGFSDYLHPYDENHIIGFGQNTSVINDDGIERVINEGMKMVLFDVSDFSNPKVQFSTYIGDSNTYSQVSYDHKAFLFSKEKNLIAFPINDEYGDGFQGAYIYNVDLEKGFTFKGKITHTTEEELNDIYSNSKPDSAYWAHLIERIFYIDNRIYTLSRELVKASDLETLEEIKSLELK
ncbi:beta-propeller domain-containing protein [Clostridium grantii]|uniref:Secreted protein containing C-terminal beta-propeller domain n=1 Tax=Clostridium grantii DSM 8605 TaxID=1121316 RepID=A0A1M5VEK7_9CLOT|nr:beta-propeller domain-containing protein [Clostridium grantii]SHH73689.1 Secreted protein containing C-terminal beta-propeller domain [Clostridium grantii DSM 8605]